MSRARVRDYREFCVWGRTMLLRELSYAATQTARHPGWAAGPAAGRLRSPGRPGRGRPAGRAEEGARRAGAERRDGPSPRDRRAGRAGQRPQWLQRQGRADRHRQARPADPARPAVDLRPAAHRQVPAPLPRPRRQDRLHVRPRHEHPRDPGPPARAVRHRGLARPGRRGHRRGAGRGGGVAGPAARGALPLVFLDALRVKVRDEGTVRDKAVHVALGVRADGAKEVLGLWVEQTEGAKFWLRVMNELKERGVADILIAVVDGLKGFPEAISAVFPKTQVQACVVHLIRRSLDFVSYKDRKEVAAALKEVYRARTAEAGQAALQAFDEGPWGRKYPVIAQTWRRHWAEVIPFYAFPAEVRRINSTANAIESLNAKLRRAVRVRGHFPHDDAVLKLLFLVLNLASKDWKMPQKEWSSAKAQFAILFEDRFAIT